ncbi:MAG: secretion system protein [Polynucleobacter sp. 24-46-87]|jgi:type IV pilus assembly protein PilC|uniref:type II secretion system F family protein n=1 Tax=unclassified Polynucleobacter TaxID=2640945 RepID=UPI000BC3925D|nr:MULTISPECIES: type II secretion system F family protein [unclassified Polynucleobacter]OYY21243.1 MAG: secretion system protein [Polynucleobacter sp. 35-46-11]OZA15859.1 MAG: secretion system protein [Polynucleobacter sp. 24-46-87]OZA77573.1 MAG: secretion system protein [Polynucleobacter sp. 39-46-10]
MLLNRKLSKSEQLHFAEQMLALLQAGLPLLNAIQLLIQSAPKSWQAWLADIRDLLQKGNSFSFCLSAQDGKFSPEFSNLIRVSERTGDLSLALRTISRQLEAQIELRRKVQQSLTYPAVTLATSILLVLVMMIWVVPVFKEVFGHFQAELPTLTRILISLSTGIQNYFLEILLGTIVMAAGFGCAWIKSSSIQKYCDALLLRAPLFGNLFRLATLSHWCRTLGHLLETGLPLPDALRVTAQSSNHWVSHDFSAEIFKHLTRGWPLGESLKRADPKSRLLDVETLLLLHIGAESGALAEMLNKRAATLGAQLSSQLNTLSQSLEPALILFVGAIIGSLVIILYLPIFNLGQIV